MCQKGGKKERERERERIVYQYLTQMLIRNIPKFRSVVFRYDKLCDASKLPAFPCLFLETTGLKGDNRTACPWLRG